MALGDLLRAYKQENKVAVAAARLRRRSADPATERLALETASLDPASEVSQTLDRLRATTPRIVQQVRNILLRRYK